MKQQTFLVTVTIDTPSAAVLRDEHDLEPGQVHEDCRAALLEALDGLSDVNSAQSEFTGFEVQDVQ
jgi:hypothetical protein